VHQRPINQLIINPNKAIDSAHGLSSAIADPSDPVAQLESLQALFFFGMQVFQNFLLWKNCNDGFYKCCWHWLHQDLSVISLTMLFSLGITIPPPVDININRNSRLFKLAGKLDQLLAVDMRLLKACYY